MVHSYLCHPHLLSESRKPPVIHELRVSSRGNLYASCGVPFKKKHHPRGRRRLLGRFRRLVGAGLIAIRGCAHSAADVALRRPVVEQLAIPAEDEDNLAGPRIRAADEAANDWNKRLRPRLRVHVHVGEFALPARVHGGTCRAPQLANNVLFGRQAALELGELVLPDFAADAHAAGKESAAIAKLRSSIAHPLSS